MRHVSEGSNGLMARIRREDGSVVLALLAVLIIGGMVTALLVRTGGGQRAARFDRDFQKVVHHADAGVQQALFMLEADVELDGKQLSEWDPGHSANAPTLTIDGNETDWHIERVNARTWQVTSTSELNGADRTVVATIEERRKFFASAFAHLLAEFNNQNFADTYKSNDGPSPYGENTKYWPRPGLLGIVGSNTEVKFGGSSSEVDGVQLWDFGEGDTVAARCTGSGNTKIGLTSTVARDLNGGVTNPDYDPPELKACEADAFVRPEDSLLGPYSSTFEKSREFVPDNDELREFLGTGTAGDHNTCGPRPYPNFDNQDRAGATDRNTTVLDPVTSSNAAALEATRFDVGARDLDGDGQFNSPGERFYCFDDMTFGRNTSLGSSADVDTPVVIYASGTVHVKGPGGGTERLVNCVHCEGSPRYGTSTTTKPPPVAAALQVYLVEVDGDTPSFQMDSHSKFGGTAYGPHATCGNNGSAQAEVYGSLICDTINNVGGWKFHYDDALTLIGSGDFEIATWREEAD